MKDRRSKKEQRWWPFLRPVDLDVAKYLWQPWKNRRNRFDRRKKGKDIA